MLSIGKLVVGQQRYYEQQVAQGGDDYYSGRGEAPGKWIGAGARALGLEGRVGSTQFNALVAGADPRYPSARLRDGQEPKIAALDLTFSAPKSVSVLFAIGGEEVAGELIAAQESAVRAAVGWIEENAVQVRRGPQGRLRLPGEGLIAAAYRHRMSRALDPQLHTHVVAANLTRGPDRRFTALFGAPIYQAAKTAGYLYQSHLRAEVTERLGLEWGPVRKGAAELRDVPARALEEFSRRRHDMERAAADGGFSLATKRSAEAAAVTTRDRKQYEIDTHTWREEIEARAAEHGLGRDEIACLVARGAARLEVGGDVVGSPIAASASQATDGLTLRELGDRLAGSHGLTERANTFDERVVLQQFAQAAAQGARVPNVCGQAALFTARSDVLSVGGGGMTTADLVACEHRLIAAAVGRAGEHCAVISNSAIELGLAAAPLKLTPEQAAVVWRCASSGDGVQIVEALAGTGKTHTAGVLRAVYERAGYWVLGMAPTGRGARELADEAGLVSCTMDRALLELERTGEGFGERTVIVLDEAGMAPTRMTATLLEHAARAGAKVIAIGDPGQLPSVLAGGWLRAVGERVSVLRLTEVMRQRDPDERRALSALHDGRPRRYLDWAHTHDRIEVMSADQIVSRAVDEWAAATSDHAPGQVVMIARDNDTRARLNELARSRRADTGLLGEERSFGGTPVAVGDRVICRNNDSRVGVDNGTRGSVRHVDDEKVVIETDAGVIRELPAGYAADHLEHAYCLTGHGMQGGTVERAVVVASARDLTAGWSYSALSRSRGQTRLLIAEHDGGDRGRSELAPGERLPTRLRSEVLARVARRMLVRDDEDLAIDRLAPAGHEDDPSLAAHRQARDTRPQEVAASRAEPVEPVPSTVRLAELRDEIARLQVRLQALPTRPLARFDDLDAQARDLTAQRAERVDRLDAIGPPARRLWRGGDQHAGERAFLATAIEIDDRALADLTAERARLQRELGDPEQVRSERGGIETTLHQRQREHDTVHDALIDREVEGRPGWLTTALGDRPSSSREAGTWDRAARALAGFRLDHDVTDSRAAIGPEPPAGEDRHRAWEQASIELHRALRLLARESVERTQSLDIGIG